MNVIIGYALVLGAIIGGFLLAGGHLMALLQPVELIIIFGTGIGSFVVGNPTKTVKATLRALPTVLKGSSYSKALYMELMSMLYDVLTKVRKEGLMSVESDVDNPETSPLFSKFPAVMANHHLVVFLTDYLRLMVSGNLNSMEIENLMDNEIDTHHQEGEIPVHSLAKLGDAFPAFGIVAAVMGVVHTMESVGIPPAELGKLIAAALVGTFLGILLSYGFVSPLSYVLESKLNESSKALQCVKVTLLASLNGYAPALAVEFGRKVLYSTERPTFLELEQHVRQNKASSKAK